MRDQRKALQEERNKTIVDAANHNFAQEQQKKEINDYLTQLRQEKQGVSKDLEELKMLLAESKPQFAPETPATIPFQPNQILVQDPNGLISMMTMPLPVDTESAKESIVIETSGEQQSGTIVI